ncbi:hypothetical protein C8R47DRAFT_1131852 [Mycena vitilis]|nr:hypothetical protein C8R47DRAFT_1131852 [Mycena vitilis]
MQQRRQVLHASGQASPPPDNPNRVTRTASGKLPAQKSGRGGGKTSSQSSSRGTATPTASSSNLTPRPPGTPTAATVTSHAHHINTPSPLPPPQPRLPSGPPMSPSPSRRTTTTVEEIPDEGEYAAQRARQKLHPDSEFVSVRGPQSATPVANSDHGDDLDGPQSAVLLANSDRLDDLDGAALQPKETALPHSRTLSEESSLTPEIDEALYGTGLEHGRELPPHLDNESVTSGDEGGEEYPKFFAGSGKVLGLFKEPLYASVDRFHGAYDPEDNTIDDPLIYYGAEDGVLPGMTEEVSMDFRDALIRYQFPHRQFLWSSLEEAIADIYKVDPASLILVPTVDKATKEHVYCLSLRTLETIAHATVAVQQILDALSDFLERPKRSRFHIDTDFTLLRMLERCSDKMELTFAFSSLQLRLKRANDHIRSCLSSIRENLTGNPFSDRVSSVDSTISEVREAYGTGTPAQQLYRLIARKDYGRRPIFDFHFLAF